MTSVFTTYQESLPGFVKRWDILLSFFVYSLFWVFPNPLFLMLSTLVFFVLYFHYSVELVFDGFMRFSRYRLSQKYPWLDKIVSVSAIVLPFVGLAFAALGIRAYSLFISPDDEGEEKLLKWHERPFMIPLSRMVMMLFGLSALMFAGLV